MRLITALRSLTELATLDMVIGGGSLSPQLGSLTQLRCVSLNHYCMRGTIPPNLFDGLQNLCVFAASKFDLVAGGDSNGDCGISGTLPTIKWQCLASPSGHIGSTLSLSNNRLTGQLPQNLLSLAEHVDLANNTFTGSIPSEGGPAFQAVIARDINLANNQLEVSIACCVAAGHNRTFPNSGKPCKHLHCLQLIWNCTSLSVMHACIIH
jgi:hypothetical protein